MKSILFVCLVSAILANQIQYPGIRARFQENLINQGFKHYSGTFTDIVAGRTADLQGISISKETLLIKASLTFHTLTINKINFTVAKSVRADIQSDNTVGFTIIDIPLDINIAYDLKFNSIIRAQEINVKATIGSFDAQIKTTKDVQGCLSFELSDLYGIITNLSYELEEGDILAKLITFLGKPIFQGLIKDAINDSWDDVKGAIQPVLNQASDLLKQYYTLEIPNSNLVVDLHVINLSNKNDAVNFELNGTVFNQKNPSHVPPFIPKQIVDYQTDYPLSVQISDYTANSILFSFYDLEMLKLDLTPETLPADSPLKLNTQSLDTYFPGLLKTFKQRKMILHCQINDVPQTHFQDPKMNQQLKAQCNWKVHQKQGYILAFTQQMTLNLKLDFTVKTNSTGTYLKVNMRHLHFASLDYSKVHHGLKIKPDVSKKQFNIISKQAINIFNEQDLWLKLPIPDYMLIQDSKVLIQEGSFESGVLPAWYLLQLMAAWNA